MEATKDIEIVIDKIRKLLAKGESTENPNEKNIFIAKAHQLMAEHNLESIDTREDKVETILLEDGTKGVSSLRRKMAEELARHYGCEIVLSKNYLGKTLKFIGMPINVRTLKLTYDYCWNEFERQFKIINKQLDTKDRALSVRFKKDYLVGFCKGVTNELIRSINEFGLVVVKDEKVVDYMKEIGVKMVIMSDISNALFSDELARRGYKDGSFSIRNKNKGIVEPE